MGGDDVGNCACIGCILHTGSYSRAILSMTQTLLICNEIS